jgi:hypothetical protein
MKNNILIITIISALLTNCADNNNPQLDEVNITKIISYNVVVKDTSTLKDNLNLYGDSLKKIDNINSERLTQFIDPISFKQFINVIKNYLNDKNAFAVYNDKKIEMSELKKKVFKCDTINLENVNPDGSTYISNRIFCDSTSIFENAKMIRFTESWTIDPKTYEFKKEVLAYSLLYWDDTIEVWREKFIIYKNQSSFDKITSLTN